MKKNAIKAFTLVEMLIVIVIIGILIASLMPRMSAAQWRARDVARKNDLSQIQTAIIAYHGDHSRYPKVESNGTNNAATFLPLSDSDVTNGIKESWGMAEVPADPQAWSTIAGLTANPWQYHYKVMARNGVNNAWFVLIAHVEIAWSANYVMDGSTDNLSKASGWYTDTSAIHLCKDITKHASTVATDQDTCTYTSDNQLVYVLPY